MVVIIYDNVDGRIYSHYRTDDSNNVPKGLPYIILEDYNNDMEDENYRPILKVDVDQNPHSVVYGMTREESKYSNISLDEYKILRQEENKLALATFLKENPLLWVDNLYYGVTEEDQNEMSLDLATYQFKQSIGDTDWKLQWHSIKSDCRDFTINEFSALMNAIVNFVYPYRQLEMKYKEAIYSATTKEEVAAVKIVYALETDN